MSKHDLLIAIIAGCLFLIACILYTSRKKKYVMKKNFLDYAIENSFKNQEKFHKKLVGMVFGDKETAERLISMEKGRTPNASKIQLIRSAIERLERDRR